MRSTSSGPPAATNAPAPAAAFVASRRARLDADAAGARSAAIGPLCASVRDMRAEPLAGPHDMLRRTMGARAQAFWTTGAGLGEVRDQMVADPLPTEVMVRALHSGISRGTESLVFHGRVPPTEYQRMRAPLQDGEFPWPVKYGYASVGVVEQGVAHLVGHTVFTLHPHQTRYVVPAAMAHAVPASVPARRAVLAANMETAVNGVWDAGVLPGGRGAVGGGGTGGCPGGRLGGGAAGWGGELGGLPPPGAATAPALGVASPPPGAAGVGPGVVIHGGGAPAGLDTALRLAGDEAT